MSVWRFPWRLLILFAVLATTLGVAYDINVHGSFKDSQIGRTLKNVGLLAVCEQAWAKITVYSDKTYRWISKNAPIYIAETQKFLSPYVQKFWQSVLVFGTYVWESTQGLRDWVNLYGPQVLHWVNDNFPVYASIVINHLSEFALVLQSYLQWVWAFCLHYSTVVVTWFQEHVFTGQLSPDNLQRWAADLLEGLHVYTKSAYNRVLQLISSAT